MLSSYGSRVRYRVTLASHFGSLFVDFVSVGCKWAKLRMLVVVAESDVGRISLLRVKLV